MDLTVNFYTNDYVEYYLTLLGWVVSNGIWSMITDTGLFALPFLVIFVREWIKVRGEGADEGNKGVLALARIETAVYVGVMVAMLAAVPAVYMSVDTIKFDEDRSKQCQVHVPTPQETGWSTSFSSLGGQNARVPIWWAFMHVISKGFTNGAIAAIPCSTDLRQMRMEVDATRIQNPLLAQEVADFSRDCYGYSRHRFFTRNPNLGDSAKDPKAMADLNWIGSHYFLNNPGYYDTDYSRTPRTAWPYNSSRDSALPQTSGGGGYPTCKQWWSDADIGLRARLEATVDPTLMTRLIGWATWMDRDEVTDATIRQLVSPSRLLQGQAYPGYGGQVGGSVANAATRLTSSAGVLAGSLSYFPAMDAMRQALPMALSFLKMALVICIPLVLVIGAYDIKTTMTLSVVFFALMFVDFWFQLARWIDSTILDALYGSGSPYSNFNPLMGLDMAMQDAILNYVMGAMFIVLPTFWMGALAWAGLSAGNALNGLARSTSGAEKAGGDGGQRLEKGLKK